MAQVIEDVKSRSIRIGPKSATEVRKYNLVGYTSATAALNALLANAPTAVTILTRVLSAIPEYSITPESSPTNSVNSVYRGTVTYKTPDSQDEDQEEPEKPEDPSSLSFDFGSITDIKFEDKRQKTYVDLSGDPIGNTFTAINQPDPDLPAQGQEFNSPIATFEIKTVFAGSVVTNKWLKDRMDQVWTLNSSIFRSLPAKSVALTGMSGSPRSDGNWEITYNFEYRPTKSEQILGMPGNQIKVPATTGWEYTWAEYTKVQTRDNFSGTPASGAETRTWRELNRVHVSTLYETSDFTDLGIVE